MNKIAQEFHNKTQRIHKGFHSSVFAVRRFFFCLVRKQFRNKTVEVKAVQTCKGALVEISKPHCTCR